MLILGGVTLYAWGDASVTAPGLLLVLTNLVAAGESRVQVTCTSSHVASCVAPTLVAAVAQRLTERRLLAVRPVDVSKAGMVLLNNA